MSVDYYDRDSKAVDQQVWIGLLGQRDAGRVLRTEVAGVAFVSTVWLGLDHQYGDGPPLIFETQVFGGEWDAEQWRYTTEEEAARGHLAIVDALREGRDPNEAVTS